MHENMRERVVAEAKRLRAQDMPWTDVAREVSKLAGRPVDKPYDESSIRKMVKVADAKPAPPARRTVTIELRGPRGWSPPAFDDAWQAELAELHDATCDAETAEERIERSGALERHRYPELAAWEAYHGGDTFGAALDAGLAQALDPDLLASPAALASLALHVTESPEPSKARRRGDRKRAIALLEGALAIVKGAPLDLAVAYRRRFPNATWSTDTAPADEGEAAAEVTP